MFGQGGHPGGEGDRSGHCRRQPKGRDERERTSQNSGAKRRGRSLLFSLAEHRMVSAPSRTPALRLKIQKQFLAKTPLVPHPISGPKARPNPSVGHRPTTPRRFEQRQRRDSSAISWFFGIGVQTATNKAGPRGAVPGTWGVFSSGSARACRGLPKARRDIRLGLSRAS